MTASVEASRPPAPTACAAVAIYRGSVRHRRSTPVTHAFTRRLFMAYLDVDALPESLDRLPLWSARHPALLRFRRRDFLDGGARPLGESVRDLVEARLGRRPAGPIHLLAHLRTLGWLFNPIALYYCWQPEGTSLDAVVVEVTNTPWGERHIYVLDAANRAEAVADPALYHATEKKALHVSPFLPMDMSYGFSWSTPGRDLLFRIAAAHGSTVVVEAELVLQRSAVTRSSAATILLRYPLMTLRVSLGIYQHALRLWIKRAPLYRHPKRHRGVSP